MYGPCLPNGLVGDYYFVWDLSLRDYWKDLSVMKCTTVFIHILLNSGRTHRSDPLLKTFERGPKETCSKVPGKGKRLKRDIGKRHYLVSPYTDVRLRTLRGILWRSLELLRAGEFFIYILKVSLYIPWVFNGLLIGTSLFRLDYFESTFFFLILFIVLHRPY